MSKMINGKMYKVMVPIEGKDGATHWMRLGRGFTNKDESINCYVDAIPLHVFAGKELKLQIREYTEEDLRKRDEFRPTSSGLHGQPRPDAIPF
jgi:hypothetical protein